MTVQVTIPTATEPVQLDLSAGQTLFLLGANGTGKSNLMHRLSGAYARNARWISAHRQTWFPSSIPELTSRNRRDQERNMQASNQEQDARWRDRVGTTRPNIVIYDLIQKQNSLDREIAAAVREGDSPRAERLAKEQEYPMHTLNELLGAANLPISISLSEIDEILASKNGSQPYSISEASDGERNVILIAAEVLTVPPGTLILIDEPERHLHRSIISPLLAGLFSKRRDCIFVISTHDVGLVSDSPASKVLLVRNCVYQGKTVSYWDVDLLESAIDIDDDLKRDILGARRDVVFVEGEPSSLDMPLYSVIFPNVSVLPKGSRKSVEDAVKSIRSSESLHWIQAYGIVDSDGQDPGEREELKGLGVYPIEAYSVESIYYDTKIQQEVAKRRTDLTGDQVASRLVPAKGAALKAIAEGMEHLAKRRAEGKLRESVLRQIPNRKSSSFGEQVRIEIDLPAILEQERMSLKNAMEGQDLDGIIRQYPVRETGALDQIALRLGFDDRKEYARAVVQLLREDRQMLNYVRQMLGDLSQAIVPDVDNDFVED